METPQLYYLYNAGLQELKDELADVVDWFCFGVFLRISTSKLVAIQKNYRTPNRCKLEMLIFWQQQKSRTWTEIVQALNTMGLKCLAQQIAANHSELTALYT